MNTPQTPRKILLSPPDELMERLYLCQDEMFVFPAVASEAMELTNDPNCSMSAFACLVERDAKLATELLSIANSPLFTIGPPVSSIHQSLVRLGMRQCRHLILSVCVKGMMQDISLEQEWVRDLLWQHSFTTATACLHLNRAFGLGYQGEEFTAGLLHDFGRTLFAVLCEDKFQVADPLDFDETQEHLDREVEILGMNHCDFGAWFANDLGIPESIVEVIRCHHEPSQARKHQEFIALVAAGDHIANHIQRFEESAGYQPEDNEGINLLASLSNRNIDANFAEIADHLLGSIYDMASANKSPSQRAH